MEQAIRLAVNMQSSMINHQEWYISKKPNVLYSLSFAGLICARYSGAGVPCGMIVPMIEISASAIRTNIVSFSEQKKSQRECMKPLCFVVTIDNSFEIS